MDIYPNCFFCLLAAQFYILGMANGLHNVKRNFMEKLLPPGNQQSSNKATSIQCWTIHKILQRVGVHGLHVLSIYICTYVYTHVYIYIFLFMVQTIPTVFLFGFSRNHLTRFFHDFLSHHPWLCQVPNSRHVVEHEPHNCRCTLTDLRTPPRPKFLATTSNGVKVLQYTPKNMGERQNL